ncbi:MAG TPA: substrate-binding domain-containing protein, partial [Planosporangium sp.]|nr:substrate-binding domain-containing protein [Planosporangium sp.]
EDNLASVAMSPVVLAMPEPLARALAGGRPHKLTTEELAGLLQRSLRDKDKNIQVGVAEPRRDAASLAGAILMYDAVVTGPAQLPALVGAYRGVSVVPDQAALLRAFGQGQTIAPMTEQSVLAHDAGSPQAPLTAVPLEAAPALDYPYAVVTGKPRAVARAAEQFRAALLSRTYRDILAKAAFRDPGGVADPGFPVGRGASADPVVGGPLADTKKVADVLGIWNGSKIASRVISVTDVTAVMGQPVAPGAPTRMQLMQKAQTDGLRLFTDDSQIGFWTFASDLPGGKDYQEKVPIRPLDAVQRDRLNLAAATNQPVATNTRGLYETVLAGYKAIKDGWDEDRSNTVLVFTSGSNTKPDGLSLDDAQLELEKLTDPTKPIRVVLLGFGPDVNLDELTALAKTAGGKAFKVERPEEIGAIFLQALLRG